MKSIAFPNIFNSVDTNIFSDQEATKSNLHLILATEFESLFGDPGYGCGLQQFLFEQNNPIVRDLIIDRIYDTIKLYIPQLICNRNDIKISTDTIHIFIELSAVNIIDYTTNTYIISLTGA